MKLIIDTEGIKIEPYSLKSHIVLTILLTGIIGVFAVGFASIVERLT